MNPTLVIDSKGRRIDKFYAGFLIIFWIIWTPITALATLAAITKFNWFWVLWLPFGYLGVFIIPYAFLQSGKPQEFEATSDSLVFRGTGNPFVKTIEIPRKQTITLHFGHYGDVGDSESVPTLNMITKRSRSTRRIMISPLTHPNEKRQILRDLSIFLVENGFDVLVQDEHPKSRDEQDIVLSESLSPRPKGGADNGKSYI